jgi:sulfoxide reductase heme-binding subunit YedZ
VLTWILLRAAGVAAYLMLWATVSWGLIGTTALAGKKIARATAIAIHQFMATAAFLLIGVHIGGILLDTFVRFTPLDVAVPLHATYKSVPVALGIVSMYMVAVVLISSWARKHLSTKWWRRLHLLAVPAFALALVHGVFTGTDTVRPWMWWGYVVTGGSVLFLMLTRAFTIGLRPERHAPPLGVAVRARPGPVHDVAIPVRTDALVRVPDAPPKERVAAPLRARNG